MSNLLWKTTTEDEPEISMLIEDTGEELALVLTDTDPDAVVGVLLNRKDVEEIHDALTEWLEGKAAGL